MHIVTGTGTPVGDPVETNTLGRFFYQACKTVRRMTKKLLIGSVKTNIGHTEAAAGVAGLIKVLLMMRNGKMVPSLHIEKDKSNLNPAINLTEYNLDIAVSVEDWQPNENGDRIACVSSYGFGGSNGHAILVQKQLFNAGQKHSADVVPNADWFVTISTASIEGFRPNIDNFKKQITQNADLTLDNISYTATCRRDHFPYRACFAVQSLDDLQRQATAKMQEQRHQTLPLNLVFVYCGVGTTWTGMCSQLIKLDKAFKAGVIEVDKYLTPLSGISMEELFSKPTTDYSDPFVNHIAIFTTQIGLTFMWRNLGVKPNVIVGQSVGEVAAAYASESIDLQTAVDVIYHRSKVLAGNLGGSMMVVKNVPVEVVEKMCDRYEGRVSVAVYSSPIACTISGEIDEMKKVKADLLEYSGKQSPDIFIKELDVRCAYHSHMVEKCMQEIRERLKPGVRISRSVPVISTVTGRQAIDDELQSVEYWAQNIRNPVLMKEAILCSMKDKQNNIFLEVGPKPVIRAHINDIVRPGSVECLSSMTFAKEIPTRSTTIVKLYENGADIEWKNEVNMSELCSIPTYTFNRRTMLLIPEKVKRKNQGFQVTPVIDHMFLRSSLAQGKEFNLVIGKDTTPYVFDHFMGGKLLVPGATYVEAAFAIAVRKLQASLVDISLSVELERMYTPLTEKDDLVECKVDVGYKEATITFSKGNRILSVGKARKCGDFMPKAVHISQLIENSDKVHSDMYNNKDEFEFGPSLRLIQRLWCTDTDFLAELHIPANVVDEFNNTHIHPAVVDSMFQVSGVIGRRTKSREEIIVPKGLKSIRVYGYQQERMFCYATRSRIAGRQTYYKVTLLDESGCVICKIDDLYFQILSSKLEENISNVYALAWHEAKPDKPASDNLPSSKLEVLMYGTEESIQFAKHNFENIQVEFVKLNSNLPDTQIGELTKKTRYRAIIYAFLSDTSLTENNTELIFKNTKWNFLCLKNLLCILSRSSVREPLFVMTNNTQRGQETSGNPINLCGSELWGMVRCAQHESIYPDIRLLDIDILNFNPQTLFTVVADNFPSEKELRIEGKLVLKSRMIQETFQNEIRNQKVIPIEDGTAANLKTCYPNKILSPFYELVEYDVKEMNLRPEFVRIRLLQTCLHDIAVFPVTNCSFSEKYILWPDLSSEGFTPYAIEGEGVPAKDHNSEVNETAGNVIYFCYPVDVATYVDIPKECVFTSSELPNYTPGLLTLSVVLFCSAPHVPKGTCLTILVDESFRYCQLFMEAFLTVYCSRSVRCVYKSSLTQSRLHCEKELLKSSNGVIVLSKLSKAVIESIMVYMPNLRYIVTIPVFLPDSVRQMLAMVYEEITLVELHGEQIFQRQKLLKTMPAIRHILQKCRKKESVKNYVKLGEFSTFDNPLALPRKTFHLRENDSEITMYASSSQMLRKKGCYIVVGGLTGLGWVLMTFIAENGGGYAASISRREPSSQQQNHMETLMRKTGCKIKAYQCDITDMKNLNNAIQCIQNDVGMAQIKGIFNGAGVLEDCLLISMTEDQLEKVLKPKILGSMNLHLATQHLALDFFVMHSSIASIIGNVGQSNYGAANSFIDTLVHYRRVQNLNSQTINWGPLDVGMTQQNPELKPLLQQMGMHLLKAPDICSLFNYTIASDNCQTVLGSFNWSKIAKQFSSIKLGNLVPLDVKISQNTVEQSQLFDVASLEMLTDDQKENALFDHVVHVLRSVLPETDTVTVNHDLPFGALGIDSVVAMSFVNKLADRTGCRVPIQTVMSETATLHDVVLFIKQNINGGHNAGGSNDHFLETDTNLSLIEKDILLDYAKSSYKENFVMVVDLAIESKTWGFDTWTKILRHVVITNPVLCRRFVVTSDGITVHEVPEEDAEVNVELVSVEEMTNIDPRNRFRFSLENELPVRFQMSFDSCCTYIRIIAPVVILDLKTHLLINRDIKNVANRVRHGQDMPKKKEIPNFPRILHTLINNRFQILKKFWSQQMGNIKQKASLKGSVGTDALAAPLFKSWEFKLKDSVVERVMDFIRQHTLTLFQFFLSVFQLLLYSETDSETIPVLSGVNMQIHDEMLTDAYGRCINVVPFIANIRADASVLEFFLMNSKIVISTTEHSLYPANMILEEIPQQHVRENFPRHAMFMDDMTEIEDLKQNTDGKVDIRKIWHNTSGENETILRIFLDTKEISGSFEYNENICNNTRGEKMFADLLFLVEHCICHPNKPIAVVMKETGSRIIEAREFYDNSIGSSNEQTRLGLFSKRPFTKMPNTEAHLSATNDVSRVKELPIDEPSANDKNTYILKSGTIYF